MVRKVFRSLVKRSAPRILIIKKPSVYWEHHSKHLGRMFREILSLAKQEHLKIIKIAPKEIRKTICQDENASPEKIAQEICRVYPELKSFLYHGQKYKQQYWTPWVTSISLGLCYLKESNNP